MLQISPEKHSYVLICTTIFSLQCTNKKTYAPTSMLILGFSFAQVQTKVKKNLN
jgi:hypothetical protein